MSFARAAAVWLLLWLLTFVTFAFADSGAGGG